MATTEDVLKAVQDLTRAYESLQEEVKAVKNFVPLYSDGVCYWDGYENLTTSSELYSQIMAYGSVGAKSLYGNWHNSFMVTLPQGTAFASPKAGMPDRCFVIKMKLNDLDHKKKTVFFKQPVADNQGYGYVSAYLVNKNTLVPFKFIGTDTSDKGSGEGRSIRYDMFNGANLQTRYHSWNSYDFNLESAKDAIDEDGFVYIGFTSTNATFYVSGWGIANRNTDLKWQNGYVLNSASQPMTAIPVDNSTNSNGLYGVYFARNTEYKGFELPYSEDIDGDLLVGFFDATSTSLYQANMILMGAETGTKFMQDAVHIGNFGRLVRNGIETTNLGMTSFVIPKREVELNTVIRNGRKYIKFNIPKFLSDRNFNFSGAYTEEYSGI